MKEVVVIGKVERINTGKEKGKAGDGKAKTETMKEIEAAEQVITVVKREDGRMR